jgi:hypothetical protein
LALPWAAYAGSALTTRAGTALATRAALAVELHLRRAAKHPALAVVFTVAAASVERDD